MKTLILYKEIIGFAPNEYVCYEVMNKGYNKFFEGRKALKEAKLFGKNQGFTHLELHLSHHNIKELVL